MVGMNFDGESVLRRGRRKESKRGEIHSSEACKGTIYIWFRLGRYWGNMKRKKIYSKN